MSDNMTFQTLLNESMKTIESGKSLAYQAVNNTMLSVYWTIGMLITEYEQNGNPKAEYGKKTIEKLSEVLTEKA